MLLWTWFSKLQTGRHAVETSQLKKQTWEYTWRFFIHSFGLSGWRPVTLAPLAVAVEYAECLSVEE